MRLPNGWNQREAVTVRRDEHNRMKYKAPLRTCIMHLLKGRLKQIVKVTDHLET
jgi:hypothetical protein